MSEIRVVELMNLLEGIKTEEDAFEAELGETKKAARNELEKLLYQFGGAWTDGVRKAIITEDSHTPYYETEDIDSVLAELLKLRGELDAVVEVVRVGKVQASEQIWRLADIGTQLGKLLTEIGKARKERSRKGGLRVSF